MIKVLSMEQKRKVFNSYPFAEYPTRHGDSLSYRYKRKSVVIDLSPSGRAYVWGRDIATYNKKYKVDPRGWINVKEFSEEDLRELLDEVLSYRNKLPVKV
ncbi:hypothetical protein ACFOZY_01085 [Chungangia koreensis]|uniref:Uncharacterized protein n=1 Tax=Chungangia koreensis TaxID=752657 RepID=A0ABV8WZE4_9LACT